MDFICIIVTDPVRKEVRVALADTGIQYFMALESKRYNNDKFIRYCENMTSLLMVVFLLISYFTVSHINGTASE